MFVSIRRTDCFCKNDIAPRRNSWETIGISTILYRDYPFESSCENSIFAVDKKHKAMKRPLLIAALLIASLSAGAQTTKTVETQKDKYGHVTGTATTTTDYRGNQTTIYKDRYGHVTGKSETRTAYNGQTRTTYKDPYGHTNGTSTTRQDRKGSTTIYKDRYGHTIGSSQTRTNGNKATTTYKDRYGHVTGTSTTK